LIIFAIKHKQMDPLSISLLAASAASSLGSALFKGISGYNQYKKGLEAEGRLQDPGYTKNSALDENEQILRNRFNNYVMPGTSSAIDQLNAVASGAMSTAREGAQTSGDLLSAAARIAYGTGANVNQLAEQSSRGQESALMDWLRSNAQAGQEDVNAGAWDREQYLRERQDAANLQNAGLANQGGALDTLLSGALQAFLASRTSGGGKDSTSSYPTYTV
jgi:hypothetical protein